LRDAVLASQIDLRFEARLVYGGDERQRRSDCEVVPWSTIQGLRWP
jgi:hypothetical protein